MNRKTLLLTGLTGVALTALLVWAFAPRPVEVEVAQASIGRFESSIDEDARTRLRERFVVSAPLNGRLQRLALREGDPVQAGDVVATLMPALSPLLDERTLREQHARIGAAEAGVQRAISGIGAAKVARDQARITLRRTEELAQQGFVAPTKIDNDRLTAQAAQKELDAAEQNEQIARYEVIQARAALALVRASPAGAAFALRSPITGQVLKLHQTSESAVALGAPIMDLGDTAQMEIVAELLSTDALLAQPGSAVRIERWGGTGALRGQVRRIEPAAFTKVSALGVEEQRVNVLIAITNAHEQWKALGDGYRVSVSIITRSEDAVLRVPVSAVFPLPASANGDAGGFAVFVLDAGRARLQTVSVGARNGSDAWIQQGLSAGERVIVYPPATVGDGARVQQREVQRR